MLKSNPRELRKLRRAKGHSGYTLAEASGVSQPRISELESGSTPLHPRTAKRLADALGVEITDIATVEPDEPVEVSA